MAKIVHLGHWDKFIPPFIDFVEQHFDMNEHQFYFFGKLDKYQIQQKDNLHLSKELSFYNIAIIYPLIKALHSADKVILHGLFNSNIIKLLWLMPWLLKKCYWVVWGGDLYTYQTNSSDLRHKPKEFFRRSIIKKMGYLVTYIKGDYDLAQKWYKTQAQYQECFMYPSNLYKKTVLNSIKKSSSINILVGNSADKSNNHIDVFRLLQEQKEDIKVYVPLSYGGKNKYILEVISEGKRILGDRFIPLTDMLPFNDYLSLLTEIDVAIFNHKRQQAMGNIISLLSFGKKVYLRSDVTHWSFFRNHDITVFDINEFSLNPISDVDKKSNKEKVEHYFSETNFINQLKELFR